jgi:hypothetical protein
LSVHHSVVSFHFARRPSIPRQFHISSVSLMRVFDSCLIRERCVARVPGHARATASWRAQWDSIPHFFFHCLFPCVLCHLCHPALWRQLSCCFLTSLLFHFSCFLAGCCFSRRFDSPSIRSSPLPHLPW